MHTYASGVGVVKDENRGINRGAPWPRWRVARGSAAEQLWPGSSNYNRVQRRDKVPKQREFQNARGCAKAPARVLG